MSKKRKWKNTVEKKFCSTTRGSSYGWKDEWGGMYYALVVEKIETLRKNSVTGSDFEHKLMVRWLIGKKKQLMEKI